MTSFILFQVFIEEQTQENKCQMVYLFMVLSWMCRQVIAESSVSICEFNTLLKSTWAVL